MIDPRTYWENKIGAWDADRHGEKNEALSFIERHTKLPRRAVRYRYQVALAHLARHGAGKTVVEVGCGTGRLAPQIVAAGARAYHGIDIAGNAVAIARENAATSALAERITFERADVADVSALEGDIVFSIGFLSWLTDEQADHVFAIGRGMDFLHTTTERKFGFRQPIRWLYNLATGTHAYRVRYKSVEAIRRIAARHGGPRLFVYRHPNLYANVYISSLPFPESLEPAEPF